jgi:hypothetical protein
MGSMPSGLMQQKAIEKDIHLYAWPKPVAMELFRVENRRFVMLPAIDFPQYTCS